MDKKSKIFNTRTIRTAYADPAYKDGVLNIPQFLASRKFEIQSFELSQLKTKYASSTRVFQNLPRTLRRRTASHNVKRVPKRLRNRALKEMQDTNVTKTHKKTGRDIYRLKMTKKLLKLAGRIKLMKDIPNFDHQGYKLKLNNLNSQLQDLKRGNARPKLNNVIGSYDNTGFGKLAEKPRGNLKYYKRQRQFVWLPTHVWHAKRFHMKKQWGYQIPLKPTQKCFKAMNRAFKLDVVVLDTSYYNSLIFDYDEVIITALIRNKNIASILAGKKNYYGMIFDNNTELGRGLIYCNPDASKVLLRVHPSIYEDVFKRLIPLTQGLQDCRYSLGSIDLIGPKAISSLNQIFHGAPSDFKALSRFNDDLSDGTTMCFSVSDPRLFKNTTLPPTTDVNYFDLVIRLSQGLIDVACLSQLMTSDGRYNSYENQLPIKLLNKGVDPKTINTKIPLLITKYQQRWSLIMPIHFISSIWIKLIEVKSVKVGGEKQLMQFNFEHDLLNYPQDFPYFVQLWNLAQAEINLKLQKYHQLPKSKKTHFQYEHGLLPGCDWEFLYLLKKLNVDFDKLSDTLKFGEFDGTKRIINTINDVIESINESRTGKLCILTVPQNDKLQIKLIKVQVNGPLKDFARVYCSQLGLQYLVGFITSGCYNLNKGQSTGIGYISTSATTDNLLVRNLGQSTGYSVNIIN